MRERRHAGDSHVDRLELLKFRRNRTQRVVHLQHELPLHLVQCCGWYPGFRIRMFPSRTRIFSTPGPGSTSNNFNILTQKLVWKLWEISQMIRLVHPRSGSVFFTHSRSGSCFFTHPGSRGQKDTESRIRIRNIDLAPHFPSPIIFSIGQKKVIPLQWDIRYLLLYIQSKNFWSLWTKFCEE